MRLMEDRMILQLLWLMRYRSILYHTIHIPYQDKREGKAHYTVPGSLDEKGGRRCQLLLSKRWHHLPPFVCLWNPALDCIYLRAVFSFYITKFAHDFSFSKD
jgi:hypothetical protein